MKGEPFYMLSFDGVGSVLMLARCCGVLVVKQPRSEAGQLRDAKQVEWMCNGQWRDGMPRWTKLK